jgi:hypothetical protein
MLARTKVKKPKLNEQLYPLPSMLRLVPFAYGWRHFVTNP